MDVSIGLKLCRTVPVYLDLYSGCTVKMGKFSTYLLRSQELVCETLLPIPPSHINSEQILHGENS